MSLGAEEEVRFVVMQVRPYLWRAVLQYTQAEGEELQEITLAEAGSFDEALDLGEQFADALLQVVNTLDYCGINGANTIMAGQASYRPAWVKQMTSGHIARRYEDRYKKDGTIRLTPEEEKIKQPPKSPLNPFGLQ